MHLVKDMDDRWLAGFIIIMNIQIFQETRSSFLQIYANIFQLATICLFLCDLSGLSLVLVA
jgi:hypothetical protein